MDLPLNRSSTQTAATMLWQVHHRSTIIQRSAFILSFVALFWLIFLFIYFFTRLVLRLMHFWRRRGIFLFDSTIKRSNEKICQAFVISPNHYYGSFAPSHYFPSPIVYRSDSFFSHDDYQSTAPLSKSSPSPIHQATLLEHYLQTYNPLQIDHPRPPPSPMPSDDLSSESQTMIQCYPLARYRRLREENASLSVATMPSAIDEQCSECSTRITRMTGAMTDSSDHERCQRDMWK